MGKTLCSPQPLAYNRALSMCRCGKESRKEHRIESISFELKVH